MITSIGMIRLEMHSLGAGSRGVGGNVCGRALLCTVFFLVGSVRVRRRTVGHRNNSDLSGADDFCRKLLQIASVSVSPFDVSRYGTGYVCVPGTGTTVQDTKKMKTFALHDPKQVPKPKMEAKALQAHPNMQRLPTMRLFETFPPCQGGRGGPVFDS